MPQLVGGGLGLGTPPPPCELAVLGTGTASVWELALGRAWYPRIMDPIVLSVLPCWSLPPQPGSYSVPPLILGSGHSQKVRAFTAVPMTEAMFEACAKHHFM